MNSIDLTSTSCQEIQEALPKCRYWFREKGTASFSSYIIEVQSPIFKVESRERGIYTLTSERTSDYNLFACGELVPLTKSKMELLVETFNYAVSLPI